MIWVAVGGRGTLVGAVLGAFSVNAPKTWLTTVSPDLWLFALGGLFVAVTLFLPRGLVGLIVACSRRRRELPMSPSLGGAADGHPVVSISTVSRVTFDGFKALNDLSLFVEPGELRAIIGPNGAGKTTMMDVITGKTRPTEGGPLPRSTT